jgi:hypothetical protein
VQLMADLRLLVADRDAAKEEVVAKKQAAAQSMCLIISVAESAADILPARQKSDAADCQAQVECKRALLHFAIDFDALLVRDISWPSGCFR